MTPHRVARRIARPTRALLLALTTVALSSHAADAPQTRPTVAMDEFIRRYQTDWSEITKFYNISWSPLQANRLEQLVSEWDERLKRVDFDVLDQQGRIDYLLMRTEVNSARLHLNRDRQKLRDTDELLPFRPTIADLEVARWRIGKLDLKATATAVAQMAEQARTLRKRLEKGKQPPPKEGEKSTPAAPSTAAAAPELAPLKISPLIALRAAEQLNQIRDGLKSWFTFYEGYHPEFSWWMKKPYDDAFAAFEEYGKYLREEIAGVKEKEDAPLLGDPLGAAAIAQELENEWIPYTAEEIISIGEQEFAWCEAQMKLASRDMGFGDDWKAALAKVKSDFAPPGGQDELVAQFAREATKFVKDRNLVTVPPLCEETWRLVMTSPEGQKTTPYVAYSGQNMLVAYPKQEMPQEDKLMAMRGNNRHFTRITTAHELIPGHHLQFFVAARNHTYRDAFSTPFLLEGWALYWEMILWNQGYAQTPEDRIGMLFWRMHRAARILVTLKYHLGRMQPQEMVDFLVNRVGHEKFGATSEVRRFISVSPLYQCGYMIGGLQLRALRKELVESGKMTDREFNDTVLTYNGISVELIRAGMVNAPLTRDSKPSWKFAGDPPVVE